MERGGGSRITVKIPQGSSSSGARRVFEKKRSRVIVSESDSSDDDEFMRPKTLGGVTKEKFTPKNVYDFDEYDGFDSANLMRKRFDNGNVGVSGRSSFVPRRVTGSGKEGVFVRREKKKPYVNVVSSVSSEEESSSESDSDGPVRVQGRNGVLKLKVSNMHERPPSSRKIKPTFRKSSNGDNNSKSDESDESRKSKRRKPLSQKSNKKVINKSKSTFSEPLKPVSGEERRGKRGGGTEKQRLRERIKGMLTDAGWTIDYRPRKNQSYQDAVYVNPSGVAYWSIIKAYDALKKQLKDEEIDVRSRKDVVLVSEDIVNNLSRKAKKAGACTKKKWKNDTSGSESDGDYEGEADSDTREERRGLYVKLYEKSKKRGRISTNWDDLRLERKRFPNCNDVRPSSGSDLHYLHERKSKKIGRCTLLVRSSEEKKNPASDGFNPYSGKRTVLSWLIECGVVQLRQKVQYMNHQCTNVMLEGWITRAGIHCICCSKILSLSRFEIHAGSKACQPFQNIYLESGSSLLHCQIKAWNMQKDAKNLGFHRVDTDGDDQNDDACGICGDGGDLICCDGCPSTYHQTCLSMEVLPLGDWHCPNCTCKFCDTAVVSGGEDGKHLSLLSCKMCERRYHKSCMNKLEAQKVYSLGSASSFCGPSCLELFEKLQKYLGVKNELEGGYSWSLIHRVATGSDKNSQSSTQRIVNNSKLAVGLAIMDECFLPIIDRRSGVNLIRNVLYNCGSNFNRINYTGFYTAILERGDEIICAASLRFHGIQLAEMPFIGTRHIYRRQGMCRRLFHAIESAMRSLKIEKLVIPAIPDFLHAWTGNFGFSPLDASVRKEMRSLNAMVFPGIDMLQKPLLRKDNIIAAAAAGDVLNSEMETEKKPELASSTEIVVHSSEVVADDVDCYKNTFVSNEENIPVSVETAMETISKPEGDELKSRISSSCQITLKPCTKQYEDTGSSCEDVNVEAAASLVSQEIVQASVENNLSSCISGIGSSDMSSISQEATKSEQTSSNGDTIPSCKDNDILGSGAKLAESKDNAFADGLLL